MRINALSSPLKYTRLSRLTIGRRLLTLISVMAGALVITAVLAFLALSFARESAQSLHQKVSETTRLSHLVSGLQQNFVDTMNNLNTGMITWSEALHRGKLASVRFEQDWQALQQSHTGPVEVGRNELAEMAASATQVQQAFTEFESLGANQSRAALELFILNDLDALVDPFLSAANGYVDRLTSQAEQAFIASEDTLATVFYSGSVIILFSLAGALILGSLVRRSIIDPIAVIADTVTRVQQDDNSARTKLDGIDELSQLGLALDHLLDEKVSTLLKIERENETLNDSVIELLEGSAQLSERDFTAKLQVREDITGPVADAMNLVAKETAEALVKISQVSDLVESSSVLVDEQTRKVVLVAAQERQLVDQAIKRLESLSGAMNQIAQWGQSCNQIAQTAAGSTDKAFTAVTNTIASMDEIRDAISETEKRIKRLSERSQEISGIIDIINSIAERTHVLALNASMQAAAAGEAGRGFAVVADEVQRLAESSRNSTSQISSLVRSIQSETADAVNMMNGSISQVVNGSRRAEQAGAQMQETLQTTRELQTSVERIAESSGVQAKEAELLRTHADKIEKSTRITDHELKRQSNHTQRLRLAAGALQQTVGLFRLPELPHVKFDLPVQEAAPVKPISALEEDFPAQAGAAKPYRQTG